jgi:hypothetical protein
VFRGDIYLLKRVGVCGVAVDNKLEILGVGRESKARIIMAGFVLGLELHYDRRTSVVASTQPSCLVIGRSIRATFIHVSIHVCNCPWQRTTHGLTPGSTVFRRAHFPAPVEIRSSTKTPRVSLLVPGESPQYRMRRVWGCGGLESDKSLDGKASMFVGDELCLT